MLIAVKKRLKPRLPSGLIIMRQHLFVNRLQVRVADHLLRVRVADQSVQEVVFLYIP